MATVTLLYPRKFTVSGKTFVKGVKTEAPDNVASYLDGDPRFTVDWEGKTPPAKVTKLAPAKTVTSTTSTAAPAADLLAAVNQVDAEIEENFDDDGKPAVAALAKILGRDVTAAERDAAFAAAVKPAKQTEQASRTRIIRKASGSTTGSTTTETQTPGTTTSTTTPAGADPSTEGAKAV